MTAPFLTPLRRISTPKGDVLHGLKASDPGFAGFGEVYFSQILQGETKGWKRHFKMVLNLVCLTGRIHIVVRDMDQVLCDVQLAPEPADDYQRLTVPPGYFVAFRGVAQGPSMLLNVASIPHDPAEAETVPLEHFLWTR
ncbi:dTDP-4-dehydrorhamnose 3,5-epimerase [Gluconacetobacter azotocaptans]|uniref:dTDP-4-dehydrorhamnose 3,5-epimerase n=1 Tax=Gluconacetobacter azotocaptans TaxID=142834 RepID=UPI0022328B6F|nr:dTDP-4-dehydrorhamnose 3,5-epimerase [Gluconacetobacter azotocaptans]